MSFATPITYPVTHYQSTAKSAPQYRGEVGDVLTIIKACLVTGYGDQPSAGWTALYEDHGKITLKRPATIGSHYVLQIHDNSTACTIRVQDNPSNIDDTQSINPQTALGTRIYGSLKYSPKWHLIACERAFLLYVEVGESANHSVPQQGVCYYFGDMMSDDQTPICALHFPQGSTKGAIAEWYYGVNKKMDFFPNKTISNLQIVDGKSPNALILTPSLYYSNNNTQPFVISIAPWCTIALNPKDGKTQYGQSILSLGSKNYLLLLNAGHQYTSQYANWIAVPLDGWSF